jgi:hypothetical protein
LTANEFNQYVQNLYGVNTCRINKFLDNQLVAIGQYSCQSSQWIHLFGPNTLPHFSCDGYQDSDLHHSHGTITGIHENIIDCEDEHGLGYHLQVAPCSHFEGQRELPQIGDRIYWKGSQSSSGNIYVIVATTCDCE